MPPAPISRLRTICLALPQAEERETWGEATFRVRGKIFAMGVGAGGVGSGRDLALWCKAPAGSQAILVGADPGRFFAPPYLGHRGWVGMRLAQGADWAEVAALVRRSFRLVAPRKVAAGVE